MTEKLRIMRSNRTIYYAEATDYVWRMLNNLNYVRADNGTFVHACELRAYNNGTRKERTNDEESN